MKTKIIYILVMAMIISLCSGGACFAQETSADAGSEIPAEITYEAGSDTTPPAEEIKAPAAPEGVKAQVKTISNNIKLSWKKVKNCDGYRVYRYSSSSGKYILKKNHQRQQHLLYGQKTQIQQNLQIQGMRLQAAGK